MTVYMPFRENEMLSIECIPVNCNPVIVKNSIWEGVNPDPNKKFVPYTVECFEFELDARSDKEKQK